jgi:serine/threonine protein kinase
MDNPTSEHPTDETLNRIGLGALDEESAGVVNAHLEKCALCREHLAAISITGFPMSGQEATASIRLRSVPAQPAGTITYNEPSPSGSPQAEASPSDFATHPDYELKRELGRGGMGVVYLVHNKLMGRDEVLKVMGRHIIDNPGVFERFLREIRAVAKLRHDNIVTAYSAVRLGESIAFAMEYVEGLDLSKLVRAKGPLPVVFACNFASQVALGLQHAHEEGLVHRDIKPGNLMLTRKGKKATVKVLDFGLAKVTRDESFVETLTQEGQALGTPDFIAPEQITNAQTVDIRADIYSLGATLYFLLTGRPPFKASSLYDMFKAHIYSEPDPLIIVRPEVPPELAAVVARMMSKDPSRRFQTPRAVADSLELFFREGRATFKSPEAVFSSSGGLNAPRPPGEPTMEAIPEGSAGVPGAQAGKANASTTPEVRWESLIAFRGDDDPEEQSLAVSEPTRQPAWVWPSIAVGVLMVGLLVGYLVLVSRVKADRGELVFDGLPDDAVVAIDGSLVEVERPESEGPARVSVAAGEHSVKVELKGDEVAGEEVTINAGDQKWLRVRLLPNVGDRPEKDSGLAEKPKPSEVAATQTTAAATPPQPLAPPPSVDPPKNPDVLYADTFDKTESGWSQQDPELARNAGEPYHYGYANGVWFNSGSGSAEWSQGCPYHVESEFQLMVVGRVLDATPESRGRWTIHVRPTDLKRRGFQIGIERNGVFALGPSFWDKTALPSDPRVGPIVIRGFRPGTEFNTLVLRVKKRQVQILCNGIEVCPPVSYDWDLTSSSIDFGVDGYKGSYRAEFDQIEIKKLARETTGQIARADSLQPGSIWLADPGNFTFTILEREGERIKARFLVGGQVREIHGTIKEGRLHWLARDVKVISGKPGGDHEGEIKGDEVLMSGSNSEGSVAGKFTLKLSKPSPVDKPASPGTRTPNLLFLDEFDDPLTGWDHENPKEPEAGIHRHGYFNGVFFLSDFVEEGVSYRSYPCVRDFGGDFQVNVSGRVLDATPDSRGFWTVHLIPRAPGLRGLQVGLDRSGVLMLEPSFWNKDDGAGDPRMGPISARKFQRGNKFNTLTLRVKKRQVEILVNSVRVAPIALFGWDLTPATLHLGLNVARGSTRAEFDRIEVKEILSEQVADQKH